MISWTDFSLGFLILGISVWFYRRQQNTQRLPYPPGPKGLPFIGTPNGIPLVEPYKQFIHCSKEYNSDIIRFKLMGTDFVVINSLEGIQELFDKRSSIYSDRPYLTMLSELVGFSWAMPNIGYNDEWRAMHRTFDLAFSKHKLKEYQPIISEAIEHLLQRLETSPEKFIDHFQYTSSRIIMRLTYGIDIASEGDPYVEIAERAMATFGIAAGESYLVDVFPILKWVPSWFPGASFKRRANAWRPYVKAMADKPFEHVKDRMVSLNSPAMISWCSITPFISEKERDDSPMYSNQPTSSQGGIATTVSSLTSFILAVVLNPEIQTRAQEEIDKVIGRDRLPDYSDYDILPYVGAIVNEALRWHPAIPIGIYHRLQEDDEFKGYFLPKGSICIANSWAILHDEKVYPDPLKFNPDRYFDASGQWDPNVLDPSAAAFGFGKRTCPGRYFGKRNLWTQIAAILAKFNISRALDENGNEIIPEEEYQPGLLIFPKPFKCSIVPRSRQL
ncbi:cytochrome P450 [Panus rudis PR-1116 ss-1]|nr:cytochrome P450 [Panus rudis PR-1116 ss-1]